MSKEFFARKKDIDELQINKANASDVYTKEEVINKITEKVSEIVADAPEDFDTLKEMSDWINKHEGSAAAMNTAINTNKTDIADIQTTLSSKVDKEEGKSLVSDSEIARLAKVENYDDTQIKNDIAINHTTLGTQCKNLLKNETGNTVMGGVTFTHNSDGSVTLNGTSDGQQFYTLMSKDFENILGKRCILTGCPANGSNSTFGIYIRTDIDDYIYDSGAGVTFTTNKIIWINIVIRGGVTFNNVTFYPMLRYADITDDTYEPYSDNVDTRLIENKSNTAINKSTLGYQCKNLLKNTAATTTKNGITFTVNDDKSVTLNGTSTAQVDFYLRGTWGSTSEILQKNKYIASIGVSQLSTFNGVVMHCINNTTLIGSPSCIYPSLAVNGAITAVYINVAKGYTFSNYKLYPMLRYADITDGTYEPYKPSVKEQIVGAYFPMTVQKGIGDNTDLNTIIEVGNYICWSGSSASTMSNCPTTSGGFRLIVTNRFQDCNEFDNLRYQWIIPNNQDSVLYYRRSFDTSTNSFGSWYSFGGTVVS